MSDKDLHTLHDPCAHLEVQGSPVLRNHHIAPRSTCLMGKKSSDGLQMPTAGALEKCL